MFENIKSFYLKKIILSLINEEKALNLIKYNKTLQNNLGINLLYYKLFIKRYIVYETEQKVKFYSALNDQLLFEGEFLNGKRNGK